MEFEKLEHKEKQQKDQKKINAQPQSAMMHEDEKVQLEVSQEILGEEKKEDLISESFPKASMKDDIDELGGKAPAGPAYIGMEKRFTVKKEDDSKKMEAVRDALAFYLDEKEKGRQLGKATDNLIKACDKYCSGRFRAFKWGRGRQRLEEVLALREQAMQQREILDQKSEGKNFLIYNSSEEDYNDKVNDDKYARPSTGRVIVAGVAAAFGTLFGNIAKLVTFQPLWRRRISWTPGQYYQDTIELLDRKLGRVIKDGDEERKVYDTLTSHKDKLRSKTLSEEERLIKADLEMLERIEAGEEVYDEEEHLDAGYMRDQERISKLKERDANTRTEIEQLSTEEEKSEFQQKMQEIAQNNILEDKEFDDVRLDKRDEEYNEEYLDSRLIEFEEMDLNTVSFLNHADMLRDYSENRKLFEKIRSTHYQLMKGLLHGYKIDDNRLIKLRAKFTCAFEMQQYMIKTNEMVLKGKLDLTGTDDELRTEIIKGLDKTRFDRIPAKLGDTSVFLAECEQKLQTEYDNRKDTITKVYGALEKGSMRARIPSDILKKKMESYESNSVIYDYMQRRTDRFCETPTSLIITTYNERHKADLREISGDARLHLNWVYGKKTEDVIRLTKLFQGPGVEETKKYKENGYTDKQIKAIKAKGRLQYFKEMIRELKEFDFSSFDIRDMAKFYDDYERKYKICGIFANTESIAEGIKNALSDIRDARTEEMIKKNPEYKPDPKERLTLPEDYSEFVYNNLEELVKDMYVTQAVGNAVQAKYDTLSQMSSREYLAYYSLSELFAMDQATQKQVEENAEEYCEELVESGVNLEKDRLGLWVESFRLRPPVINMAIRTRPITKKQEKEGVKQQVMDANVDVMEILEEEKAYYDRRKCAADRTGYGPQKRKAESEKGEAFYKNIHKLSHSRDALVEKRAKEIDGGGRFYRVYLSAMAYFKQDTEEKTNQRLDALSVPTEKATTGQKQAMAKELESAFKLIMDFDLKELNFERFTDLIDGAYEKTAMMTYFCMDFNHLFSKYEELMDDPESGTLLTVEEYKEVKAKKDFLQVLNTIYNGVAKNVLAAPGHESYDGIELLSLTQGEMNENLKNAKSSDKKMYLSNVFVTLNALRQEGIYPGIDMEQVYKSRRVAYYDAPADDRTVSIKEKLKER